MIWAALLILWIWMDWDILILFFILVALGCSHCSRPPNPATPKFHDSDYVEDDPYDCSWEEGQLVDAKAALDRCRFPPAPVPEPSVQNQIERQINGEN